MKNFNELLSKIAVKALITKGNTDVNRMINHASAPREANEELLFKILENNKESEYGKKYHFGQIKSIEDFRKMVPICEYRDLEEYVERIYYNNEKNVLTSDEVIGFAKSSGSIGKQKIIPKTSKDIVAYERYTVTRFLSLANDWLKRSGRKITAYKGINILAKDPTLSPFNLPSSNVADIAERKYQGLEQFIMLAPLGRQFKFGEISSNYAFARFGLEDKNMTYIFFVFAKGILEFIEYIKDNWEELVNEIEIGTLNENEIYTDEVRKKLAERTKPNRKRAAELRKIFEAGFDENILKKIWPNMAVISTIGTSVSFEKFISEIEKYSNGVSIDYSIYGASEGLVAAAYEVNNPKQILLLDSCYYEFAEEEDDNLEHILSVDELEIGKKYEIIITNQSGFYRYRIKDVVEVLDKYENCPVVNFVYRKGQLLNINGEKTTLEQMDECVKRLSDLANVEINDWCVNVEKGDEHYCYVLLQENSGEVDLSKYSTEFEDIISNVNLTYSTYKFDIAKPKIYTLKSGTSAEWHQYKIDNGAPESQVKPVKILDNEEKAKFFYSRILYK